MVTIRLLFALFVVATLQGCATNPRFETSLPSESLSGEKVCEVPQHWKALALSGVNTMELSRATIVQVKMPAEWVGDSLGWAVPVGEREVKYLPRLVWTAMLVTSSGEKRFYPAISKNPLINPYLTVVIPDLTVREVEGRALVILSGAQTKALTTKGEIVSLRSDKDCISALDSEFFREFPSVVRGAVDVRGKDSAILRDLQKSFPWPIQLEQSYSLHSEIISPEVMGDVRQVTFGERFREQGGGRITFPLGVGTLINNGVPAVLAIEERYVGPFGERQYTVEEVGMLMANRLKGYTAYVRDLESRLGKKESNVPGFTLAFEGSLSGWTLVRDLVLDIEDMWSRVEDLREAIRNKKGATK